MFTLEEIPTDALDGVCVANSLPTPWTWCADRPASTGERDQVQCVSVWMVEWRVSHASVTDVPTAACVHDYIHTNDMSDGMIISSGTCSAISAKEPMHIYIYVRILCKGHVCM